MPGVSRRKELWASGVQFLFGWSKSGLVGPEPKFLRDSLLGVGIEFSLRV